MQAAGIARPAPVLKYAPPPAPPVYVSGADAPMAQPMMSQPMTNLRQAQGAQQPVLKQGAPDYPQTRMDAAQQDWYANSAGRASPDQQMAFERQMRAMQSAQQNASPDAQSLARQAEMMGLDPVAAMMDPTGFQQYLAQQGGGQQQAMTPAPMSYEPLPVWQSGGDMPGEMGQPMTNLRQAQGYEQPVLQYAPTSGAAPKQVQSMMGGTADGAPVPPGMEAYADTRMNMMAGSAGAGGGVGRSTPFTGDIGDYLGRALNDPGGYSFGEVEKLYSRLGQDIDDQFTTADQRLREEMASRGIADSTIFGGRSQDLNVAKRSAKQDLLSDLGTQQAQALFGQQTGWLDRLMGYGQNAFNNDMTQAEFNRLLQSDQDRMMLALLGVGA